MNISRQLNIKTIMLSAVLIATMFSPAPARDTDIYSLKVEPNCYILMDNSGSMDFGVYEHTIDYGEMFDYLFTLNESGTPYNTYIYDTVNNSDLFYQNHRERHKIFLWKGNIGVTIATVDGQQVAFTGDAADPSYQWSPDDLVDTHTLLNKNGDITDENGTVIDSNYICSVSNCPRITVDSGGYILLDGQQLPLGLNIKFHDFASLYDGTCVDNGFGGLLNAPGYYFSGYEGVSSGNLDIAEDGDNNIYFFLTGNWANMQAAYNLYYTTANPGPQGASSGDPAWKFELFPLSSSEWSLLPYSLKYPDPDAGDDYYNNNGVIEYENNIQETDSRKTIVHPGTTQIQVHFSSFDVNPQRNEVCTNYKHNRGCRTWGTDTQDFLHLYDANGNEIASYNNDNFPSDGWSPVITGDTVDLRLSSGAEEQGQGYEIDKIRVTYHTDSYLMQTRLDIARDAISYVVDEFRGKVNWGFASFKYNGTDANGANIRVPLNPSDNDDANKAAIQQQIANVDPMYGTPLGEALQDIFEVGYYGHRNILDNLLCRKNYTIVMTDGFPSGDDDWSRISGAGTFFDADGDGWTQDPYQYSSPPGDYYDDVAHWMYTHSWIDKSVVLDPESSYVNVITHHIAFGAKHPLLQDAAGESGGEYITAYNKGQLVAAFYSFVLSMSEAVSFIAPVVSVDAANKIQSGDDLYTGLFFPKNSRYWIGNLKKFRFGDGSSARPDMWMIYDGADKPAIDSSGAFLDNTAAIWADDNDVNDSDSYGAADVQEDGAGEVLTERVAADFLGANYYERSIYTCKSGNLTNFTRNNITPSDLGINSGDTTADNTTRDKIVNFIYGYTYDADATTGDPVGAREWALGSIIHSRPVVIDYYDPNDLTTLQKRYIAVGANDGMLHIFDDADGQEAFAFVPEDLLGKLQDIPANDFFDSVDGHITLYRRNEQPKYLIFGERRGGLKYWCLDISDNNPANWTVAWDYSNPEIRQSWSEAKVAKIQIGAKNFKDVLIFTGGYHEEEDNYPEPFDDEDNSGSPFSSSGSIDPKEWKSSNSDQDVNGNGQYDKYNPDQNEYGRGVFVVDIDNPFAGLQDILPFSVTYGATNVTAGLVQTLADMKYCFPASPSIVTSTLRYTDANGHLQPATNILQAIYAIDIYGNIYKITYDYCSGSPAWTARKIFSANPGSSSSSGTMGGGDDTGDQGRKSFYSPAISWGGAGLFFDAGNYRFRNTRFEGTDKIASLFVGTGDGEHPQYSIIRNCFYAIYDDSSLTAETARLDSNGDPVTDTNGGYVYDPVDVSSYPYTEDDLLNLTCDELGADTTIDANAGFTKDDLLALLRDDPIYDADTTGNNPDWRLEAGSAHEGDAKGWYIILEDQGDVSACSHCTYDATIDASDESAVDNHSGEKVLSQPSLYYRTIYFTTYQPAFDDPCKSQGNGFNYALNYEMGSASLNLNGGNSSSQDITDRYRKHTNIYGIPSGFEIVTRNGHAAALASMGGAIIGGGEGGGFEIPSPGLGLELFYWLEGNSEK